MESHDDGGCLDAASEQHTSRVRELNDNLRVRGRGGRLCISRGVVGLGPEAFAELRAAIAAFADFSKDNDPYDEHDFGVIEFQRERFFWKVDCYDTSNTYGSPDPSDPSVTSRILTIMLAGEY